MTMEAIISSFGEGGAHAAGVTLRRLLTEMQGLRVKVVAGAAANTKMNVADLRVGDTLIAVVSSNAGVLADDSANVTIQATAATGTVTAASVAAADTVTVNGTTYTFRAAPTLPTEVKIGGSDAATATNLAATINAYETRFVGSLQNQAKVTAVAASNVVTATSVADATAGNAYTLTSSNGTRLAVSGAGTLTGGTATGGIKSTTNNTGFSMLVVYWNKDNA